MQARTTRAHNALEGGRCGTRQVGQARRGWKEWIMKVGQTGAAPAVSQVTGNGANGGNEAAGKSGKAGAGSHAASVNGSAKVQLSNTAKALLDGADGGFDQAKVDRVRQAIADGSYKVNHEAIADKLIANAQELLGKVAPR
jgi:negative regulator of flagellin synthesis FlgM